jgi:hypothetical protein
MRIIAAIVLSLLSVSTFSATLKCYQSGNMILRRDNIDNVAYSTDGILSFKDGREIVFLTSNMLDCIVFMSEKEAKK